MRITVQRVTSAKCIVSGNLISNIASGLVLLVGFTHGDDLTVIKKAVKKILSLRIFNDHNEKMNLNLTQVSGEILSISQFTLYANTSEGNRPSFTEALNFDDSKKLYDQFNEELRKNNVLVATGIFGANMQIELTNDGPVTINLEF